MADDPTTDAPVDDQPSSDEPAADHDDIWTEPQATGAPSQRTVRMAQLGLIAVVVLIIGIVVLTQGGDDDGGTTSNGSTDATASAGTSPDGEAATPKPTWPKEVTGRPEGLGETKQIASEVQLSAEPGVYLWGDFDGWHLWVVNGEGIPPVTGTLTSNADIDKAVLAVDGAGTVDVAGKTATFSLPADVPVAGIDFNPGFYSSSVVVDLKGPDGAPIDATLVTTGAKRAPAPFPLALQKG